MDTAVPLVSVRIVIPGTPRAWERAGQRIVKPKEGKQFIRNYTTNSLRSEEGAIKMFAQAAMQGRPPMTGALDFRMAAYRPVPTSFSKKRRLLALDGTIRPTTKPDLDNYGKLKDALKGVCFIDDAQITDEHLWKRYSEEPRIVIEVREIG